MCLEYETALLSSSDLGIDAVGSRMKSTRLRHRTVSSGIHIIDLFG